MKKIEIKFNTLDGDYTFIGDINNKSYLIETNIQCLESKSGDLTNIEKFLSIINDASILSWDNNYPVTGLKIEDAIKWSVRIDNKLITGEEGYWPYGFDLLINAIESIDEKAAYFKTNLGID